MHTHIYIHLNIANTFIQLSPLLHTHTHTNRHTLTHTQIHTHPLITITTCLANHILSQQGKPKGFGNVKSIDISLMYIQKSIL